MFDSKSEPLSRRDFIKLMASVGGAAALASLPNSLAKAQDALPTIFYGRLCSNFAIHRGPTLYSSVVRYGKYNEIVDIVAEVEGPGYYPTNSKWYQLADGNFIHSAWVQPVNFLSNTPVSDLGQGAWGEITVPIAPGGLALGGPAYWRLYYSQVHRVVTSGIHPDTGEAWYYITMDGLDDGWLWVPAAYVRLITPEEIAPISPEIADKKVVVDRFSQTVNLYENNVLVKTVKTSTGAKKADGNYTTAPGTFNGLEKRMTRKMAGGAGAYAYATPGIGYTYFFTNSRTALHACFWHNNFGWPMSHGCINMTPDDAKYVWRWVHPIYDYHWGTVRPYDDPNLVFSPVVVQ
jgi:hypothetical protein